jgi:hypothetical protein
MDVLSVQLTSSVPEEGFGCNGSRIRAVQARAGF